LQLVPVLSVAVTVKFTGTRVWTPLKVKYQETPDWSLGVPSCRPRQSVTKALIGLELSLQVPEAWYPPLPEVVVGKAGGELIVMVGPPYPARKTRSSAMAMVSR
jgi:hypothetical protein